MDTEIIVALVGALSGAFALVGGWVAAARLKASEQKLQQEQDERAAEAEERAAEAEERARLDTRVETYIELILAENTRLRGLLETKETRS